MIVKDLIYLSIALHRKNERTYNKSIHHEQEKNMQLAS